MRVAVWYNLPSGGAKRAIYDHVKGLLARGHHVEAWAPETRDEGYLSLSELVQQHVLPLKKPKRRTPFEFFGVTSAVRNFSRIMDDHCRQCAEQINAGGFDVLFANSCFFTAAAPIGRFVNIASVLYLQEPFRYFYEAYPRMMWRAPDDGLPSPMRLARLIVDRRNVKDARIQVREEIRSANAFGRVLCNSYYSRESILRAYGLRARVCYLGIDATRFEDGPPEREPYVVGLGSFTHNKGQREAVEAIAAMKTAKPKLVWVGNYADDKWLAEFREFAAGQGVELETHLAIPDEELAAILRRATAMVYTPRLEPFGYAPLEANACGTPVVAVAEGGVRETIVDGVNGVLVEPDPASMAAGLDRLFADPGYARQLGRKGRELALTTWSLDAAIDRLEAELIDQVAQGR